MNPMVRRFRRAAYAQVLLGIVAFGVASQNFGLLLVAGALAALAWLIAEGPWASPLPRGATNLGGLAATVWLAVEALHLDSDLLLAMSHFTLWLQVLLLFSRKSNREYASMLTLSVMTMVSASVLSVSIVYGLLLVLYCGLALLTLLLFHMKVSADTVYDQTRAAADDPSRVPAPDAVAGPRYRLHFRLTAVAVALLCAAVATASFVLLPRAPERSLAELARVHGQSAPQQAGFSDRIDLRAGQPRRTGGQPVLHVKVTRDGQAIGPGRVWRLRGAVLDEYQRRTNTWTRSSRVAQLDQYRELSGGTITFSSPGDQAALYRAQITHRQGGGQAIFTGLPPVWLDAPYVGGLRFNPYDHQLAASGRRDARQYEVAWAADPPPHLFEDLARRWRIGSLPEHERMHPLDRFEPERYARGWYVQPERVAAHARRILAEQGLSRQPEDDPGADDLLIARALADHMRRAYTYSLDAPRPAPDQEPLLAFLFDHRQGHCELFASGLAAMTRALGMRARVVTGYLVQHYNHVGDYYVVRQSDAHAWVEIDAGPERGWVTVDPTPEADAGGGASSRRSWLAGLRELYEHIEYAWLSSVVTFDQRSRDAMLTRVGQSLGGDSDDDDAGGAAAMIQRTREMAGRWAPDLASVFLTGLVFIGLGLALLTIARLLVVRRRRLAALQLTALPRTRRRGLARRLGFYLTMLDMLERHGHKRPPWQSPASFAEQLAQAHPLRLDPVVALTEHFYEIRFGHRELTPARRRRIGVHLKQLERSLAHPR